MRKYIMALVAAAGIAMLPAAAQAEGDLAGPPSTPIELNIIGNVPELSQDTIELETGVYYRLIITSDGVEEFMFQAESLLRNSHIRLVVINDIEIHMQGMLFRGIEFDDAGTVWFSFVVLRPGDYEFTVGPATGTFVVR